MNVCLLAYPKTVMEPSATPSQQFTSHEEAYKAGYNAAIEEYISNPGGLKVGGGGGGCWPRV